MSRVLWFINIFKLRNKFILCNVKIYSIFLYYIIYKIYFQIAWFEMYFQITQFKNILKLYNLEYVFKLKIYFKL